MGGFDRLINRVYEAAADPDLWPGVMHDLGKMVDAAGGVILTRRSDAWMGWRCSPALALGADAYLTGPAARSQSAARVMALDHAGFVTEQDAFPNPEDYLADVLMTDWGTPAGLHHAAVTVIPVSTGDLVVVQVNRRIGETQFASRDIRLLDAARPHLARAGLLAARWRLQRLHAAAEALSLIGLPAAILDSEGKVIAANSLIEAMDSYVVWLPKERLALRDRDANALLQDAFARISDPAATSVRSFPVKGMATAPAVAHLIPTTGVGRDLFDGGYGVLVLTTLAAPSAPDAALLRGLFDLTAAEARVASLLTEGLTLAEIAERQAVSVETVRTQLKSLFAKTGKSRQTAVAGLLAAQPSIPLHGVSPSARGPVGRP